MMRFTNATRPSCKCPTVEGFGPDAYVWREPDEILCPCCGRWSQHYGAVSQQAGDDPDTHEWLCLDCGSAVE